MNDQIFSSFKQFASIDSESCDQNGILIQFLNAENLLLKEKIKQMEDKHKLEMDQVVSLIDIMKQQLNQQIKVNERYELSLYDTNILNVPTITQESLSHSDSYQLKDNKFFDDNLNQPIIAHQNQNQQQTYFKQQNLDNQQDQDLINQQNQDQMKNELSNDDQEKDKENNEEDKPGQLQPAKSVSPIINTSPIIFRQKNNQNITKNNLDKYNDLLDYSKSVTAPISTINNNNQQPNNNQTLKQIMNKRNSKILDQKQQLQFHSLRPVVQQLHPDLESVQPTSLTFRKPQSKMTIKFLKKQKDFSDIMKDYQKKVDKLKQIEKEKNELKNINTSDNNNNKQSNDIAIDIQLDEINNQSQIELKDNDIKQYAEKQSNEIDFNRTKFDAEDQNTQLNQIFSIDKQYQVLSEQSAPAQFTKLFDIANINTSTSLTLQPLLTSFSMKQQQKAQKTSFSSSSSSSLSSSSSSLSLQLFSPDSLNQSIDNNQQKDPVTKQYNEFDTLQINDQIFHPSFLQNQNELYFTNNNDATVNQDDLNEKVNERNVLQHSSLTRVRSNQESNFILNDELYKTSNELIKLNLVQNQTENQDIISSQSQQVQSQKQQVNSISILPIIESKSENNEILDKIIQIDEDKYNSNLIINNEEIGESIQIQDQQQQQQQKLQQQKQLHSTTYSSLTSQPLLTPRKQQSHLRKAQYLSSSLKSKHEQNLSCQQSIKFLSPINNQLNMSLTINSTNSLHIDNGTSKDMNKNNNNKIKKYYKKKMINIFKGRKYYNQKK